jgi:hypothetical protein
MKNSKPETVNNNDVIYVHHKIKKYFENEYKLIPTYKKNLTAKISEFINFNLPYGANKNMLQNVTCLASKYNVSYDTKSTNVYPVNLKQYKAHYAEITELDKKCEQLNHQEIFYDSMTKQVLERYKQVISIPIKSKFVKNSLTDPVSGQDSEFEEIIQEYRNILESCFDREFVDKTFPHVIKPSSIECLLKEDNGNTHQDNTDEETVSNNMVFDDLSRINFNQSYKYDKKLHFRHIILQYQGLENRTIPKKVYDDVELMIKNHNLKKEEISKEQLKGFLVESKHSKYYEDLQHIYHKITGKPLPNIQKYEKKIYDDFDLLVDAFLRLDDIDRKSFLNGHYVLRQLLLRHNYVVPEGDLNTLKTLSRLREHDDIYQRCCEQLSWNFKPTC